jgi:tetratricopeptide (TPR) repeat protein
MQTPSELNPSLDQLRENLAMSTEEHDRAYCLEILGIRLSTHQEYSEALDCFTRAVAIRSRLAQRNPELTDRLAATLTNQGQVLSALARYAEAVAAHAHALDIYGHLLDKSESLSRYADNAALLAEALRSRGCDALAARFHGRAVAAFLVGPPIAGGSEDRVLEAIGRLGALLDASTRHGEDSGCTMCQDERLLVLSQESAFTATALSNLAFRCHMEDRDDFGVQWATRAVAYCDLFASTRADVSGVRLDNLFAIGKWSIALGGGDAAIRAVRRAIDLYESNPFLWDQSKLAASHYIVGVLQAPQTFDATRQNLVASVQTYEDVLAGDPAKYTPRLAEALHGLAIVTAATGREDESTAALSRSSAMWTRILENPTRFDTDADGARQRLQFLAAAAPRDPSTAMSTSADIHAILTPVLEADRRSEVEPDRRLWCCTGRDFFRLIGDLAERHILSSDVHTLARQLRFLNLYPARDLGYRCQPKPPDLFVTYDWSTNFVDLQQAVNQALQYLAGIIGQARPNLTRDYIQGLVFDHIGIWVDFVFIDQCARDVVAEVREVVPAVIGASDVHFVLSPTALTRSWCCYELALFNRRQSTEGFGQRTMRSFVEPPTTQYTTFGSTTTSVATDKPIIEQYLRDEYPGGLDALDLLLIQASMLSDPFMVSGFAQFGAADQTALLALDKWIARIGD